MLEIPWAARHLDYDALIEDMGAAMGYWWDYSTLSKSWFGTLACHFEFSCFVWFREPVAFFKSCYVQDLKDPEAERI